jgi:hypothetical protein
MKPDGTLTVEEIMQHVNLLQVWEKEDLAKRMGYGPDADKDDDKEDIDDAYDAVNHFGERDLLNAMDDDYIIEYLEDHGYRVKKV